MPTICVFVSGMRCRLLPILIQLAMLRLVVNSFFGKGQQILLLLRPELQCKILTILPCRFLFREPLKVPYTLHCTSKTACGSQLTDTVIDSTAALRELWTHIQYTVQLPDCLFKCDPGSGGAEQFLSMHLFAEFHRISHGILQVFSSSSARQIYFRVFIR